MWIPLEARYLNSFKKSFKETLYVFSFILDDRIICSWWLGVLNIRFNVFFVSIDVLIKILKVYRHQNPSDSIEDICPLILVEEDDFGFDLCICDLILLDFDEIESEIFRELLSFLYSCKIEMKSLKYYLKYVVF